MRQTTRLRILDYLRRYQTASVQELSRRMALTGADIRHHLAVLESYNQVEVISRRRDGRGRPENTYALSRQLLGDGLDGLLKAVLFVWLRNATEATVETELRSVASILGGSYLPVPDNLLTHRLTQLVDRLNELRYQARWEAGMNGPTVILGNCPYSAIIDSNIELCHMDAILLEQWTGSPAEQTAKLKISEKGVPYCAFRVTSNR
jgi:predicted ArsR family transcriptional regulator